MSEPGSTTPPCDRHIVMPLMAEIVYFYDRRFWPSMVSEWGEGYVAICPDTADPFEWRASARRLARHLGCNVRTGLQHIETQAGRKVIVAEANGGYPLGLTDPHEREAWARAQCRGCDDEAL